MELKGYLGKVARRTRYRRPILILIGTAAWCLIVIPVLFTYIREGYKHGAYNEYRTTENDNLALIKIDLLNMDPATRKADFLVQIDPQGIFKAGDGTLKKNMTLNLRFKQLKWPAGSAIEPFTLTVPFIEGTLRDYPLDKFVAAFPVSVSSKGSMVPVHITTDAISQLFRIRFSIAPAYDQVEEEIYQQYPNGAQTDTIVVTVVRPPTTLMVCVFMAMLMWALAIALVNVAWDAIVYRREIPPPILSIGVAMLFALPALRNSQPGVPAMGCLLDMCSFFWSIVLIAISSSSLIFSWVLSWKPAFLVSQA